MGATLEVQVLPKAGHSERSEAQGRKGDRPSEGSVERSRGPTNRNRIRGDADRGERANDREALVTKGGGVNPAVVRRRRVLTWGDLALRLKGRRGEAGARSQQRP